MKKEFLYVSLIKRYHLPVIMLLIVPLLSACLFEFGDTDSVKEASELGH